MLAGCGCSQHFGVGSTWSLECLSVASSLELFVGQERSVSLMLISAEHTLNHKIEKGHLLYSPEAA